jgi:hypothetical protein
MKILTDPFKLHVINSIEKRVKKCLKEILFSFFTEGDQDIVSVF